MALIDDYLPCKAYQGHEMDPKNEGFVTFQDKKTLKYYFALVDSKGDVLLKSEGYKDSKSRKNGIDSVIKNLPVAGRLSVEKEKSKFVIILKAGNNKEIARSCDFKSQAEANTVITGFEGKKTEAVADKTETKTTTPKATKAKKVIEKTETVVTEDSILKSLDNFLEESFYLEKERIWDSYGMTGFVKFRNENGKHYFGVYNPDATLYLRSEGFKTEDERDNAFDVMESAILLEENYKVENLGGKFYAVLFEEHEVLAISPSFDSFIEAFVTTPGGRPKEYVGTMY
jgi:uncharacterized protein YegP (UPF0339 family)